VGIISINATSPLYSSQMVIYGASFDAALDGLAVLFAHVNGTLTTTRQAMAIASQSAGWPPGISRKAGRLAQFRGAQGSRVMGQAATRRRN
jgi:hypothetical protein